MNKEEEMKEFFNTGACDDCGSQRCDGSEEWLDGCSKWLSFTGIKQEFDLDELYEKYTAKQINLVPAIKEMEAALKKLRHDYKIKNNELQEGLKALRKLNTVCENCSGKGKILRSRVCAEDDRPDSNNPNDYNKCFECMGTGKANYPFLDKT